MYFEDFSLHDSITIPPVRIDEEEMVSFAKRYDNIPLHTDKEYAEERHEKNAVSPENDTAFRFYRRRNSAAESTMAMASQITPTNIILAALVPPASFKSEYRACSPATVFLIPLIFRSAKR